MFGDKTPEQKEERLKVLDEQTVELEAKLKTAQETVHEFEEHALANVEKFHKQKTTDITDILITYIVMTIERCKKGRSSWVNIREACEAM